MRVTSKGDNDGGLHKPFLLRDGARHGIDPAWIVRAACQVPAKHRPYQRQREDDEQADAGDLPPGEEQGLAIGLATGRSRCPPSSNRDPGGQGTECL